VSEVAVSRLAMTEWDSLAAQGRAIAARLQLAFPASLFQFKYMPANADRKAWQSLTQGNQPFLGLGFVGVAPKMDGRIFLGVASWMLLLSVRQATGTPRSLFYGDAQGIGVLKMAGVAVAVLQGFNAATGAVEVRKVSNAVSEAWADDCAVIALDLAVPLRITLADTIQNPGCGIFEEMAETWNFPTANGSTDVFTSDWENPNV
jgi:hypothetical protein